MHSDKQKQLNFLNCLFFLIPFDFNPNSYTHTHTHVCVSLYFIILHQLMSSCFTICTILLFLKNVDPISKCKIHQSLKLYINQLNLLYIGGA